jgi:hypothetical protein
VNPGKSWRTHKIVIPGASLGLDNRSTQEQAHNKRGSKVRGKREEDFRAFSYARENKNDKGEELAVMLELLEEEEEEAPGKGP